MKRGVIVSDIHCGSFYGMLPPDFITFEGVPKLQNPGQKYLWECWLDFVTRAEEFAPAFVIVNGDAVDGMQNKSHGAELSLQDWKDQRRAAIDTLRVLRSVSRKAKWYFTQGTPYHVGHFGDAEEDIAEAMDATPYPSVGTGRLCRECLWLEMEGVTVEACHHISVATGFYRLTPLDREGQWSAMASKDPSKGVPKADLLVRSHVHFFGHGEHASKQMVTTPCWQLQTRYMRKNSMHRMLPDIGGVFVEIDGTAKKRGEVACRVRKELYPLPQIKIAHL